MHNFIKIVIAGDVDSGKSTFIGRYLYESKSLAQGTLENIKQICENLERNFEFAYLLDSFEEERKKELTIDTTQCFCKAGKNKNIVFIDVPGHQELLKNMLSGASLADTAILTVDISKSVKDQTKRHAFILKFLGISKIIPVINKMDAVAFNQKTFLENKDRIFRVFKNLGIEFSDCVPICANQGDNVLKRSKKMPWYKGKLVSEILDNIKIKKKPGDFRFLIQDIYKNKKEQIAAGIIISGSTKVKDKVFILPAQKTGRIKTIKYSDQNIRAASHPLAIGIILEDMSALKRGQILSGRPLPLVTRTIPAKIICTQDIDLNTKLSFCCTVQQTRVKIKKINQIWDTVNFLPRKEPLKINNLADLTLITKDKIVVEEYQGNNSLGRFVLLGDRKKIAAIGTIL